MNETKTFSLPTSGYVYILAVQSSYGVGCVYVLRRAPSMSSVYCAVWIPSNYFTVNGVSGSSTDISMTSGQADGEVHIVMLA